MRYGGRGAALLALALSAGCTKDVDPGAESARGVAPGEQSKSDHGGFGASSSIIAGGRSTPIAQIPWQIALLNQDGEHFCGGSIVHERWIVTAAHCVEYQSAEALQVVAGRSDLGAEGGQARRIARVILHPDYLPEDLPYDIALLELDEPLDLFGSDARAIPMMSPALAEQGAMAPGTDALVSGWGALRESGPSPDRLQSVWVPIVSDELADEAHGHDLGPTQFGAGFFEVGGADTCQGDSGGPLVVAHPDGGYVLAGVASWGEGCGDARYPGIYARVSALRSWIDEQMGPDAIDDEQLDFEGVSSPVGAIGVMITEILTAPERAGIDANGDGVIEERDDEFIEIINSGTAPYALGGTSLSDARAPRFVFPAGTTLEPGELAVVFGGGEPAAIAGAKVFAARGALALADAGEVIVLRTPLGGALSTLKVPQTRDTSYGWNPNTKLYEAHASFAGEPASPGRLGQSRSESLGLMLSEICAAPSFVDDLNGDGYRRSYEEEFVEVWNQSARPIELSDYELRVDGFTIGLPDLALEPGAVHVIFGGGRRAAIKAYWGKLASVAPYYLELSNEEGIVELARVGGETVDAFYYSGASEGLSAHRTSGDDDEVVETWSAPTPGWVAR